VGFDLQSFRDKVGNAPMGDGVIGNWGGRFGSHHHFEAWRMDPFV